MCTGIYARNMYSGVLKSWKHCPCVCCRAREKGEGREENMYEYNDNTMMNKRGASNIARIHVVPIAMSPIQGDTAGMQRASGCIRLASILTSVIPTGSFL